MFSVTVRDHLMVAHSFRGDVFGPAQALHGATFVVDLTLRRADLDENGIVADIGALSTVLGEVVAGLTYRNLDEHPAFEGRNSTTEELARYVADTVADRIADGALGTPVPPLDAVAVTLHESHVAWAGYERTLRG